MPAATLLQRLTALEELCTDITPSVLRHWEAIHQVLIRKADMERKYLERLEGRAAFLLRLLLLLFYCCFHVQPSDCMLRGKSWQHTCPSLA